MLPPIPAAKTQRRRQPITTSATCSALLGRVDEAVQHFEEALRLSPDYAEAHNNLAIVRAQQGDFTDALACCDRACAATPISPTPISTAA